MILAVTGATGFVGSHLIDVALATGHRIRALTRRPQPPREGVEWIAGALDDQAALRRLVSGADATIHVAGVVSAPDRAGFVAGNVSGTGQIVEAALAAGPARLIHVSSLAAREPTLSAYGWSKREGEWLIEASPLAWTIVRPPGVYGPRDAELLDVFRLARRGLALLPPRGRVSIIAAHDLARLLVALAEADGPRTVLEPDDGAPLSHAALARSVGTAVGRRVRAVHLPRPLLALGARLDRLARGSRAKLTPDRVGYLAHRDWTADPARRPSLQLWRPAIAAAEGLADTARWYREQGLL